MSGENHQHWHEYSNLQYTKHKIIREYLNGWFPKLGFWAGKILYVDTHAGRGKYSTGEEGSPIVAIKTFLQHKARERILANSTVDFVFIELDKENCTRLKNELQAIEYPAAKINVEIIHYDSFKFLSRLCNQLSRRNAQMVPCFMFIDPFGFTIPCELLQQIMKYQRSELLLTIMWRELDMSIMNQFKSEALLSTLNKVFGCENWQEIATIDNSDSRAEAAVKLLRNQIGAKWSTYIKMLDKGRIRYLLLHLTNHDDGRDLIKDVLWNSCPEGGWFARKSDDPKQYLLIKPEPDLKPLEMWVIDKLSRRCYTWDDLKRMVREKIWLNKHLWQIVRELKNKDRITAINFTGRFSQKANPTLRMIKN